jgi:exodeoxyribonuclease V alpha subunit
MTKGGSIAKKTVTPEGDSVDAATIARWLNCSTRQVIGYIDDVDPEVGELKASFDGRSVTYGFGELDTLVPAYAATIHKSQGSEYPAVVIPVLTQHYPMLQRNLLYTGVTRGKRLVVLVGQKKAIAIAVRNVSGRRRWSKLDEWLRAWTPSQSTNSSKAG